MNCTQLHTEQYLKHNYAIHSKLYQAGRQQSLDNPLQQSDA